MPNLKLIALDIDDLAVVSAHVQDAVLKVGDMAYLPRQRRLAMLLRRFDWQGAAGESNVGLERRQAALRFERVLKAQFTGLDPGRKADVLSLLAIRFEAAAADDPKGIATLQFSGGAAIRLEIECVEVELRDLGPAWRTKSRPRHPGDERT